jgi:hypothetical protein
MNEKMIEVCVEKEEEENAEEVTKKKEVPENLK